MSKMILVDEATVTKALEALEEIALAGMSVAPEMIDSKDAFHARQAWRFIGIAARAMESVKKALAEKQAPAQESMVTVLPDGSAFSVVSFPLPHDHWLYAPYQYMPGHDDPVELPSPVVTHADRDRVVAAIRYAVRGATMCGKEPDFDPDALVQNATYALCGPFNAAPQAQPAPVQEPMTFGRLSRGMEILAWNRAQAKPPIEISKEQWVADELERFYTTPQAQPAPVQQASELHGALADLVEAVCSVPDGSWPDGFRWASVRHAKDALALRPTPQAQPSEQDLPDLIAGSLGVSRGTAYDMMREALAEQPEVCCGNYATCSRPCTPRGGWLATQKVEWEHHITKGNTP